MIELCINLNDVLPGIIVCRAFPPQESLPTATQLPEKQISGIFEILVFLQQTKIKFF